MMIVMNCCDDVVTTNYFIWEIGYAQEGWLSGGKFVHGTIIAWPLRRYFVVICLSYRLLLCITSHYGGSLLVSPYRSHLLTMTMMMYRREHRVFDSPVYFPYRADHISVYTVSTSRGHSVRRAVSGRFEMQSSVWVCSTMEESSASHLSCDPYCDCRCDYCCGCCCFH